jgi:hypothetical protein
VLYPPVDKDLVLFSPVSLSHRTVSGTWQVLSNYSPWLTNASMTALRWTGSNGW